MKASHITHEFLSPREITLNSLVHGQQQTEPISIQHLQQNPILTGFPANACHVLAHSEQLHTERLIYAPLLPEVVHRPHGAEQRYQSSVSERTMPPYQTTFEAFGSTITCRTSEWPKMMAVCNVE